LRAARHTGRDRQQAHAEIKRGLADPKIKQRFAEMGVLILGGSPEDFGRMIADETVMWGKAVKFSNVSAD
jgi:tripartite-type tricarboxylate transporter receptor subunit TctC